MQNPRRARKWRVSIANWAAIAISIVGGMPVPPDLGNRTCPQDGTQRQAVEKNSSVGGRLIRTVCTNAQNEISSLGAVSVAPGEGWTPVKQDSNTSAPLADALPASSVQKRRSNNPGVLERDALAVASVSETAGGIGYGGSLWQVRERLHAHEQNPCSCVEGLAWCDACEKVCKPFTGVWFVKKINTWKVRWTPYRRCSWAVKTVGYREAFVRATTARMELLESKLATGPRQRERAVSSAFVAELEGHLMWPDDELKMLAETWLEQERTPCLCQADGVMVCGNCRRVCRAVGGVRLRRTRPGGCCYWVSRAKRDSGHYFSTRKLGWRRAYSHALRRTLEILKHSRQSSGSGTRTPASGGGLTAPSDHVLSTTKNQAQCAYPPPWSRRKTLCFACAAGRLHANELIGVQLSALEATGRICPGGVMADIVYAGWRLDWLDQDKQHRNEKILAATLGFEEFRRRVDDWFAIIQGEVCGCGNLSCGCKELQLTKLFRLRRFRVVSNSQAYSVGVSLETAKSAFDKAIREATRHRSQAAPERSTGADVASQSAARVSS